MRAIIRSVFKHKINTSEEGTEMVSLSQNFLLLEINNRFPSVSSQMYKVLPLLESSSALPLAKFPLVKVIKGPGRPLMCLSPGDVEHFLSISS